MKKSSKYYLLLGGFLLTSSLSVLLINLSLKDNNHNYLKDSSDNLKINSQTQQNIFQGEILTKVDVEALGWSTKTEITLADWVAQAPNVTMISESATDIGVNAAFSGNTVIQSIQIPAKITDINFGSFYNTTALTSLTFEANSQLNIIGANAFRLSNIASITLPNTLTSIGDFAFEGSDLISIAIPDEITHIKPGAFANTRYLQSVTFGANSKLSHIENGAFLNSSIVWIRLPNSIQSIWNNSFSSTTSLENIEIPTYLTGTSSGTPKYGFTQTQWNSISWLSEPFLGDTLTKTIVVGLGWNTKTEITLADWVAQAPNVTMISESATSGTGPDAAFSENATIQSIEIPAKVTNINFASFYNTAALTSLTFEDNSQLSIIQNTAFRQSNISSIILPDTLTDIGSYAFDGTKITSINIPDEVTFIRLNAFRGTSLLKTVTFGANSKLYRLEAGVFLNSAIESINLPDSVESIRNDAFGGTTSLVTIEIPATMRGIPATTAKYGFTQTQWDSITWRMGRFLGELLTRNAVLGLGWDTKEAITLDDWKNFAPNVTVISNSSSSGDGSFGAFANNTIIQSIEIPSKVISINYAAFLNATSLTTIIFDRQSSLERIQDKAFNATSITSITIPDSIKEIGTDSFANTNLTLPGNQISIPKPFMEPSPETPKYGFNQEQWESIIWRIPPFLGTILTKLDVENLEWDTKISITLDDWKTLAPNVIQLASGNFEEMPFYGNSIIKSIQIPNTIKSINKDAFSNTISLVNIQLPFNLTKDQNAFLPRFGFTPVQWNSIVWSDIPKDGLINSIIVKELLKNDSIVGWDEISSYDGILLEAFKDSSVTSIEIKFKDGFIIQTNAFLDTTMLKNIKMNNFFKENVSRYGFTQQQIDNIIWTGDELLPFSSNFYIIIGVSSALVFIIAISNVIIFIKIKKINDEAN